MKKVLLNGANGKMSQRIKSIIEENPHYDFEVVAFRKSGDGLEVAEDIDIVIDFSLPFGTEQAFELAREKRAAFLTGTTGLSDDFIEKIAAEKDIPVFFSPNMSIGVFVFTELLKVAEKMFSDFEPHMHEVHHAQKKDAPSGTAKKIARAIKFPVEEITYDRIGDTVGKHSLTLVSKKEDEQITLTHEALNRDLFANSAVIISKWLVDQKAGFYKMEDFIKGLKNGK